MKPLIFVLSLLAFFQVTFIPLDLVLIVLVIRAFIRVEESNLYLAFFFGLLISLLEQNLLGIHSLVYLTLVQLSHLVTKAPFSKNVLTVIPLVFVALLIDDVIISAMTFKSIQLFPKIIIETTLVLPIYIVLRIWEERFIIRNEIKLKI
jgi:rod shape-determining protein MreD